MGTLLLGGVPQNGYATLERRTSPRSLSLALALGLALHRALSLALHRALSLALSPLFPVKPSRL